MKKDFGSFKDIREASKCTDYKDKMVEFLYVLMRDYLPCGLVEEIMRKHVTGEMTKYCNGWLADYAFYVASRLENKEKI